MVVEAAGGKALPCIVDVRDEKQISDAVEQAVEKFGGELLNSSQVVHISSTHTIVYFLCYFVIMTGIDILVNNASAINLTGTVETSMKKVDLMLGVNLRGTYLTWVKYYI